MCCCRQQKELIKALETPEEKRARRVAKKVSDFTFKMFFKHMIVFHLQASDSVTSFQHTFFQNENLSVPNSQLYHIYYIAAPYVFEHFYVLFFMGCVLIVYVV